MYDRTGTVELARLGSLRREVIAFGDIPDEMLDATTSIEDQEFWTNPGFDPLGILSAGLDTISGRPRGASTITQQLVRDRLLPEWAFEGETYERKLREIIQSAKLTDAYPGEDGKETIITAYLNNSFYGNNTYGVQAAAYGYFGKPIGELTLAQYAILAGIPQSPTSFNLMRNAEQVCISEEVEEDCEEFELVVPADSDIVVRRNHILELMKANSPKSGARHSAWEYEAAKKERVVLTPRAADTWRAAHFVWQVRRELGAYLCPDSPDDCELIDTGGYKVITTLDWKMQRKTEKWVYTAGRAPNAKSVAATRAFLKRQKIPANDHSWILALRGKRINNAAAAVMDYRTGQILAYAGSASYTAKGGKRFQPQFDVLADGWRQPGSSIKPINYAIGIDDKTVTAATMFMDVVTNFGSKFTPTQADKLERGPVRLRSALQFSFNVPAIKQTLISGIDHIFEREQDFGIRYQASASPVLSMGIGTLETHPIDMITGYGTIANGGVKMPRTTLLKVLDDKDKQVWPQPETQVEGERVISRQAAYIITDILAGNTQMKINPYWGKWAVYDGKTRRPAAYKTGTTNENRDVHAYGYLAAAEGQEGTGAGRRGVDGQQQQRADADPVAGCRGAVVVVDHAGRQQGPADRQVQGATGSREGEGRRLHRPAPGPVHHEDRDGALHRGHRAQEEGGLPDRARRRCGHGPALAGRLRRSADHARLHGPLGGRGQLPELAEGQPQLGGPRGDRGRRPRRTRGYAHELLPRRAVRPVRSDLGRAIRPDAEMPAGPGRHAAADLRGAPRHPLPAARR